MYIKKHKIFNSKLSYNLFLYSSICLIFIISSIVKAKAEVINILDENINNKLLIKPINIQNNNLPIDIKSENTKEKANHNDINNTYEFDKQIQLSYAFATSNKLGFNSNTQDNLSKNIWAFILEPKLKLNIEKLNTNIVFSANLPSSNYFGSQNLHQSIRQAYIHTKFKNFDISLGKQLFTYGKTDILTLQDQFAPKDLTWQGDIYQKAQLGELGLKSEWWANDKWSFTGALIAQDNGYTLTKATINQLKPFGYYPLSHKPYLGGLLRADYKGDNLEYGLWLSHGVNPSPAINTNTYTMQYIPEWRIGIDGNYAFNQAIWRYDVQYAQSDNFNFTQFNGFSNKRILASTGIDASLWQDAKILLQGIYRYEFNIYTPNNNYFLNNLSLANQQLSGAFKTHQYYLSATLKQNIGNKHDIEVNNIVGEEQNMLIARYIYNIKDGLQVILKAQYIKTNKDNNLFSQISHKKLLYINLSYFFM